MTNAWTSQRPRPSFSYVVYRDGGRTAPAEGQTLTRATHTDRTVTAGNNYRYTVAVEINGVELRRGAEQEVNVSRDTDGDGLIDITTRQQLNAMRYDLDGDGTVDDASNANGFAPLAPPGGSACPSGTTCTGYELLNDIALSGAWTPIGGNLHHEEFFNPAEYRAIFEGNGNTISGLRVSLSDRKYVGLFGAVADGAEIRNVGLENVNVRGRTELGALVGRNYGTIAGSWVTGSVSGNAHVGGLVGVNRGTVERSYSSAAVTGVELRDSQGPLHSVRIAGLVGLNQGTVQNTYATGAVRGVGHVSGLVGWNNGGGRVENSYATGRVTANQGSRSAGGLVGWQTATVTDSYWDTQATGQSKGAGQGAVPADTGKTTAQLQKPTDNSGIYANWSASVWNFGTAIEYPLPAGRGRLRDRACIGAPAASAGGL